MFNNPFHRVVADSKGEREQLDHLLRIAAPHERIVLACTGMLVLAFSVWAVFGSVERYVIVEGLLIEPGARKDVVSAEPGRLIEFLVAPGESIEPGQPVARQSVPELEREAAALRDRVNLLRSELEQAGGNHASLRSLLATARVALLQMEAQRSTRALIVSQDQGLITSLFSVPGDYLTPGTAIAQVRDPADHLLQAVLRVDRQMARRLRPGMKATVEYAMADGRTGRSVGQVNRVTAGPLPDWLAGLKPAVPRAWSRVDIAFSDPSADFSPPDGTPCRIRIALGRYAPITLLTPDRS